MKFKIISSVLEATAITATSFELDRNLTNLPHKVTLAPDAIDILNAHGLWVPDTNAFSRGQHNVENVDAIAENLKFEESGLDINDLVSISIGDQNITAITIGDDKTLVNTDVCAPYPDCCKQCHTCEEACLSLILCIACWIICEGACFGQGFCKDNGCD
ncbi:hypothetical protein SLS53_000973 [Cytospora paraplurivora]|uniref:Uncharacterized protein n=1 Tax=Cytospora paraplurivora TaxID=2898453 RepID=A0AAN9UK66_9PEZI